MWIDVQIQLSGSKTPVVDNGARHTMQRNYARIFLLSHMRAFTSLAGHILGSHPHVSGYFEMHLSYETPDALHRQLEIFGQYECMGTETRYIFDKLLHDDYRLDTQVLAASQSKVLVSLLSPEQTLPSIVDLFARKEEAHDYASPVAAMNYYVRRLETLADYCTTAHTPYYYYDAEMFQADPETLLPGMSRWLQLDPHLTEHYQVFSQTGKAGKGDSSQHIHSGKIDRTPIDYSHVEIPDAHLARAEAAYRECRERIVAGAADAILKPSQ